MSGEKVSVNPKEIEIAEKLRRQWYRFVMSFGGNLHLVNDEFDLMLDEYKKGDGRSYHNLNHIGKVDEVLKRYLHLAKNYIALKFAGDGHDVVYVPGSSTNEADSAVFMEGTLGRLGIPSEFIEETSRIILLTKDHKTKDDDVDGKLMIDADFAIFASTPEEYNEYAKGIWNEFVGSGRVSEADFRTGRGGLLKGWLGQDRIYLTDQIRDEMEPQARFNLQNELDHLTS